MTTEFASEKQLGKESRGPFASLSGDPTVRGFRVFVVLKSIQSTSTARKGRRILEDQAPVTATKLRSVHCTRAGRRRFLHSENASVFIESPSEQTSPS